MAEAQSDEKFAAQFATFITGRRDLIRGTLRRAAEQGEIDPSADLDVAIDFVFGLYWYRIRRTPRDRARGDDPFNVTSPEPFARAWRNYSL